MLAMYLESEMTEEQAQDSLKIELDKAPEEQDQPLLRKLFRATFKTRRASLSTLEDGAVAMLFTEVPLLKCIDYVSKTLDKSFRGSSP